jgi:excisionase family DNA binding protein
VLIAHHTTASAIAPHAADRSWVAFLQTTLPAGVLSPIRIIGMKGGELGRELRRMAADNAYDVQIIGLIASVDPDRHAQAIGEQYAGGHMHDGWYQPSADLIAFIQHHGKSALQELLGQVNPAVINEHVVDLKQIAKIIGCAEVTVRRMIERGEIPFLRAGWGYRFQPAEVIAAMRQAGKLKAGRSSP